MNPIDWFRVAVPGTGFVVTFMRMADTCGWVAHPMNSYAGNTAATAAEDPSDDEVLSLLKDLADDCANSVIDILHPGIAGDERLAKIDEYSAALKKGIDDRYVAS